VENNIRGWVCHELQNPLNSIVNSIELIENYLNEENNEKKEDKKFTLKKKIEFKECVRSNLMILKSSSKMLKYFVRDMLDF
jgi:signal transduction histidine kinase